MNYPAPLDPKVEEKQVRTDEYSRAGNSYFFTESGMVIQKAGNRYLIEFESLGEETVIKSSTGRNSDLDRYVLDAEYYRLLEEGISLSHFSTFSDGDKAYVLTGPPNTGKTGVNLALNLRGYRFIADEDAPVNSDVEALPLPMPLSVGNRNMEEFQDLLDDLGADYSSFRASAFRSLRKLPVPLVGKALDRLVEPVKVDPRELNFEEDKREIKTAFYIQPENREDIEMEEMEKDEFVRKMSIWNSIQRSGFEKIYSIWRTENDNLNENIEESEQKDREILESCFDEVEVKKLRVPLERQPRKIAEFIEGEL
ncbi:MAG: hypothetical protein ABEJ56_07145 [Candidatus Nanohaloarchaea archaeon]